MKTVLWVRIISNSGKGGFVLGKEYVIISGNEKIDLTGDWHYKFGAKMEPLGSQTFIRWKPAGLYNGMISPLLNYSIFGAAWYQGESNDTRALEYRKLLPALIKNWRNSWRLGNFPFLIVQLPNLNEPPRLPGESNWALLRESQLKSLSVTNTGIAVTTDLGEWNDIHPLNKKDVAKRLAITAQNVAYKNKNVVTSPLYKSMKIDGNKIILSFENIGSGLISNNGKELKMFAISGMDKKFVWAKAKIEKNKVIVWSDEVQNPLAVRYAWANNPEGANLYNKEGLPASPFRTDEW